MEDNNDKSKTMEFTPGTPKREVEREESDIYSMQRKTPQYSFDYDDEDYEEEKGEKKMMYAAISLAVILVIVITAGIFVIRGKKSPGDENKENDTVYTEDDKNTNITEKDDNKQDEEIAEKSVSYSTVFYGDSVIQKGSYYTILADIYDKNMKKVDNRKLLINSETNIYENGKRITPEALVYTVEALAGEGIIFDCRIRESDNFAEEISFKGSFKEQLPEKEEEKVPETEEKNEDVPAENIPAEDIPTEDNN